MRIPEEIKEQIRYQADIVDVISEVVDLKRRGANYLGLCPFHNEKTPSFTVSDDKRIFKCFGCGESGDVITFMMKYHGLSYPEALKELAKRAGINIPEDESTPEDRQRADKRELAYKASAAAAEFFHKQLYSQNGKIAQAYYNKRGFSLDLIKEFALGYSLDTWDALKNELLKQNFPETSLIDAGLLIENEEKQSSYDRFRGRAIFPIHDYMGRVIGFGARQLEDDKSQAKYINSPQTIIYDKSTTLYGLFQGKNELRAKKYAILAEGYADVLSLHQAGYKNAIASSGTSLTEEQLRNLSRYCKKVYIAYDSDKAGIKAAERGLELAVKEGFDVHIVRLPAGEDPDSLIKQHGAKIFRAYLDDALPFLEFKVKLLEEKGAFVSPLEKAEALRSLVAIISMIPDRLQHDDYISQLAILLKLSENQLQKIYKEKKYLEKKIRQRASFKAANKLPEPPPSDTVPPEIGAEAAEPAIGHEEQLKQILLPEEENLLNLAVSQKGAFRQMTEDFGLSDSSFYSNEGKRLFSIMLETCGNDDVLHDLQSDPDVDNEDKDFFIRLALSEYQFCNDWHKYRDELPEKDVSRMLKDNINRMRLAKLKEKHEELIKQKDIPVDEQIKLAQKLIELEKEIHELENSLSYN